MNVDSPPTRLDVGRPTADEDDGTECCLRLWRPKNIDDHGGDDDDYDAIKRSEFSLVYWRRQWWSSCCCCCWSPLTTLERAECARGKAR